MIGDTETYAGELRRALFPNDSVWKDVISAKGHADDKKVPLRVRVCIEPSARELHTLSWEKLMVNAEGENPLSPTTTALSRYAVGYGMSFRAALSRRADAPKALLLAVARGGAPHIGDSALKDLDPIATLLSAAGIACTVIGDWHAPSDLEDVLRSNNGVDYIYLLIKDDMDFEAGAITCALGYESFEDKDLVRKGLAQGLIAMVRPPRMMLIAPACAGDPGLKHNWLWMVHLAHESVERGVLSALTLQDALADEVWQGFLRSFFDEVTKHGQADLAARFAREKILESSAPWAPVIISRLRSGRLWYIPRLMDETCCDDTWNLLVSRIANERCTPIIGPGIDYRISRSRQQIAMDWADRYQYPLTLYEYVSLPQIAQYVAATRGDARMVADFLKTSASLPWSAMGICLIVPKDDFLSTRCCPR